MGKAALPEIVIEKAGNKSGLKVIPYLLPPRFGQASKLS